LRVRIGYWHSKKLTLDLRSEQPRR
jgi:hypothetical protein